MESNVNFFKYHLTLHDWHLVPYKDFSSFGIDMKWSSTQRIKNTKKTTFEPGIQPFEEDGEPIEDADVDDAKKDNHILL